MGYGKKTAQNAQMPQTEKPNSQKYNQELGIPVLASSLQRPKSYQSKSWDPEQRLAINKVSSQTNTLCMHRPTRSSAFLLMVAVYFIKQWAVAVEESQLH